MAYDLQYEVIPVSATSMATVGDKGTWNPGLMPHVIRGVGVVLQADPTGAGTIAFDKRVTAGSDVGRGVADVATINVAASHSQGQVVFKDGLNVKINPGEEVVAEVTTAITGLTSADIILVVEPVFENPANIAAMKETT